MRRALAVALAVTLAVTLAAVPARADLTQLSAQGFVAGFRDEIKAGPDEAWKAIVQPQRWWSDAHTWSGSAAHLSLDARAGGCWCERWGDGASAQHAQVAMLLPGRLIRLRGGLGPLQGLPVEGVLEIATGSQDGKTFLRLSYRVGGPPDAGLEALAPAVERVLGEQYRRLKALIETGRPD